MLKSIVMVKREKSCYTGAFEGIDKRNLVSSWSFWWCNCFSYFGMFSSKIGYADVCRHILASQVVLEMPNL